VCMLLQLQKLFCASYSCVPIEQGMKEKGSTGSEQEWTGMGKEEVGKETGGKVNGGL
jgi:hypothetical protein